MSQDLSRFISPILFAEGHFVRLVSAMLENEEDGAHLVLGFPVLHGEESVISAFLKKLKSTLLSSESCVVDTDSGVGYNDLKLEWVEYQVEQGQSVYCNVRMSGTLRPSLPPLVFPTPEFLVPKRIVTWNDAYAEISQPPITQVNGGNGMRSIRVKADASGDLYGDLKMLAYYSKDKDPFKWFISEQKPFDIRLGHRIIVGHEEKQWGMKFGSLWLYGRPTMDFLAPGMGEVKFCFSNVR